MALHITIDVGNTQSVFALWCDRCNRPKAKDGKRDNGHNKGCNGKKEEIIASTRISTDIRRTDDEWLWLIRSWLSASAAQAKCALSKSQGVPFIDSVAISSVVPAVDAPLVSAFEKIGAPRVIPLTRHMKFPFRFDPERFSTIGIDRLANAAAGVDIWGDHLFIVDFGTAITFCLIVDGEYRGGAIAPGIHASINCLTEKTAKLPGVSYQKKDSVLGITTRDSIENGIYFGWRGLIREISGEMENEAKIIAKEKMQNPADMKLTRIVTGGISPLLGYSHEMFDIVDPLLTLRGIRTICRLNE